MTVDALLLGLRKPTTLEERQALTKLDIQKELQQAGQAVHGAYHRLMSQEESVQLRTQAILIKSLINHLLPGTISDIVPEATITLPENLFPEGG